MRLVAPGENMTPATSDITELVISHRGVKK